MSRNHWPGEPTMRETDWLLRELLHEAREQTDLLCQINDRLKPVPTSFTIHQTGDSMSDAAPNPGNTLVFTATPEPAGSVVPAGSTLTWSSSDPTNAPVTQDSTGLIGTVVLGASAPAEGVTITLNATFPDSKTASGTATFTIVIPVVEPTSFSITQTA